MGPSCLTLLSRSYQKEATTRSITAGIVSGVAFNLFLWVSMPDVFWMWWNLFGFVVAVGISYFISLNSPPSSTDISQYILRQSELISQQRSIFR
jgi:hypothetical protein